MLKWTIEVFVLTIAVALDRWQIRIAAAALVVAVFASEAAQPEFAVCQALGRLNSEGDF